MVSFWETGFLKYLCSCNLHKDTMNNDIDQMHFLVLHIGEACCHGNWNYKNICSPFTRIYYVTKGHAQIELPEKIQDLKPGHMYVVPAFTPHSYVCHEEFCHYYIHIYNESDHDILEDWMLPTEIEADSDILPRIRKLCRLCPGMALTHIDPQLYESDPALNQNILKNKQRELYARVESRGIIYQLLAEFLHQAQPKQYVGDERISKVIGYIRTHLNEKPDLDALAALSCLSKDHLIRIFKREMKMTPLYYINKKKIEKAQLKLVTEETPIKEIAYQLGFEDQAYFNRIFKKTTGVTPMNYRNAIHYTTL